MYVKQRLAQALQQGLSPYEVTVPVSLTYPKQAWGDYATGIAAVAARQKKAPFQEVAEALKERLLAEHDLVAKVDVVGETYLNVHLHRAFFTSYVNRVLAADAPVNVVEEGEKKTVLVEHTSPNLFKPLHIGNLVGNVVGESLARLFTATGATVHRITFPSDIGLTIAKGVWGLQELSLDPSSIQALGEAYAKGNHSYENNFFTQGRIDEINQEIYANHDGEFTSSVISLWEQGKKTSLKSLNALCKRLGTVFDLVIFESEAGPVGVTVAREHAGNSVIEHSDGALFFRGAGRGRNGSDLNDSVVVTRDGYPTYTAKDLGNFLIKQKHFGTWDTSLIVTGSEQIGHLAVVNAIIADLFPHACPQEHVATGFLTLKGDAGQRGTRMSSRLGNVLTVDKLLRKVTDAVAEKVAEGEPDREVCEQVALAAIKYQILRQRVGKNIVFEQRRALSFEGDSGPYLQYTHARTCSLVQKAAEKGITAATTRVPEKPYAIERILHRFGEQVVAARDQRSPHILISYLTDLAAVFNSFYGTERIADSGDPYAPYKVALTTATGATLRTGLALLGMAAPETM